MAALPKSRGGAGKVLAGLALTALTLLVLVRLMAGRGVRDEGGSHPPARVASGPAEGERDVASGRPESTALDAPAALETPRAPASATEAPRARYPVPEAPRTTPAPASATESSVARAGLPLVALVLDDCGQSLELMQRAVRVRTPLTFAVLPHLAHSKASAELAWSAGQQVILHQPMEPESADEDPGKGVIRTGMRPGEVRKTLRANLASIPHVAGLNNHMGSRATADASLMRVVLEEVATLHGDDRPLFFLDSRTTAATQALDAARQAGVPAAERATFLDNDENPVAIHEQLSVLLGLAEERGVAVGIGHLKAATLGVLEAELPGLSGRQVRFVLLGDIVR